MKNGKPFKRLGSTWFEKDPGPWLVPGEERGMATF